MNQIMLVMVAAKGIVALHDLVLQARSLALSIRLSTLELWGEAANLRLGKVLEAQIVAMAHLLGHIWSQLVRMKL